MVSPKIQDAFNAHITEELYSANLYLAMSAHAASKGFQGFGRWLRAQYEEELTHAAKFLDQLVDRGGVVSIGAVASPARTSERPCPCSRRC